MINVKELDKRINETIQELNNNQFQKLLNKKFDDYFTALKLDNPVEANKISKILMNLLDSATDDQLVNLNCMDLLVIAIDNMKSLSNNDLDTGVFESKLSDIGTSIINNMTNNQFLIRFTTHEEQKKRLKRIEEKNQYGKK